MGNTKHIVVLSLLLLLLGVTSSAQDQQSIASLDLHVEGLAGTSVEVNWLWDENNPQMVDSYNVYRSQTAGGPYKLIATVEDPVTVYRDEGLSTQTKYYYVVSAVEDAQESTFSNEVSIQLP